ncbi:UNVERIFIED_CONTAM: hypothetical protein FKN15_038205 [Acipenser sinensis]
MSQSDAWDVDAISRDASKGEPLPGEGSVEAELTSHHSESETEVGVDDSLWSLVEQATRHLGIEWPAADQPRRSLFESPLAQGQQSRTLPAFSDFIKEVQSTWGTPASTPASSPLVKSPTLSGLAEDPACPNNQCRIMEVHLKRGYSAATEAVRLSNLASLLSVYQAALVKDLPDYPSVSLRTELGLIAQLLVKLAQLNARAQGRSIVSLVVARRQLWLSQRSACIEIKESEKIFTELIRSIEKIHTEVIELIGANEKAAVNQAEGRMKKLEQEIAELRRRNLETYPALLSIQTSLLRL